MENRLRIKGNKMGDYYVVEDDVYEEIKKIFFDFVAEKIEDVPIMGMPHSKGEWNGKVSQIHSMWKEKTATSVGGGGTTDFEERLGEDWDNSIDKIALLSPEVKMKNKTILAFLKMGIKRKVWEAKEDKILTDAYEFFKENTGRVFLNYITDLGLDMNEVEPLVLNLVIGVVGKDIGRCKKNIISKIK